MYNLIIKIGTCIYVFMFYFSRNSLLLYFTKTMTHDSLEMFFKTGPSLEMV